MQLLWAKNSLYGIPTLMGLQKLTKFFQDLDVAYFVYWGTPLKQLILSLQKLLGVPVVAGHHNGVYTLRVEFPLLGPEMLRLGKHFEAHHALNTVDYANLVRLGCENVFLIPKGVDPNFPLLPKFDEFTVLYLGRLVTSKGVNLLPQIYASANRRLGELRLLFAGNGPLEYLFEKGGTGPRWLGFVSGNEKAELLAKSHVVVMPSRRESFGLVCLEAMASGAPVISFDTPGPREYVINGFNGFLVKSVEETVSKIVEIHYYLA
jgi:glycosyltransferase involved in cell wall biosynthesis